MEKPTKNKPISVEELHQIMKSTPIRPSKKTEEILSDLPGYLELINDKSRTELL